MDPVPNITKYGEGYTKVDDFTLIAMLFRRTRTSQEKVTALRELMTRIKNPNFPRNGNKLENGDNPHEP